MSLPFSDFENKTDNDISSLEALLEKRKGETKENSGVPWLITFADLMTILLVFTFVLFMTTVQKQNGKPAAVPADDNTDTIESFVPVAHANMQKDMNEIEPTTTNVPHPYESMISEPLPDKNITILKKSFHFDSGSSELSAECKSELKLLAEAFKKNPSSEIVIWGLVHVPSNDTALYSSRWILGLRRTIKIVSFLVEDLEIEREKISLQACDTDEEELIKVSVTKAFWWFT